MKNNELTQRRESSRKAEKRLWHDARIAHSYQTGLGICGIIVVVYAVIWILFTLLKHRQIAVPEIVLLLVMALLPPMIRQMNRIYQPPCACFIRLEPEKYRLPARLLLYGADAAVWGVTAGLAILICSIPFRIGIFRGVSGGIVAVSALRFLWNLLMKEGTVTKIKAEQKKLEAEENDLS